MSNSTVQIRAFRGIMRVKKYPNKQKNSTEIYNYSAVKDAKIHLVTRANGFSAASLWFPDPRSGRNWARKDIPNKGHVQLIKMVITLSF